MGDDVKDKLREFIRIQGKQILCGQKVFSSLMLDLCLGGNRREINILATALSEKIPEYLRSCDNKSLTLELRSNLVNRLETETGLNAEAADWAVITWAEALGMTIIGKPVIKNAGKDVDAPELKSDMPTGPEAKPLIGLDCGVLNFEKVVPGSRPSKTYQVRNLGTGILTGKVNPADEWINVSPRTLDISSLGQVITVTIINLPLALKKHGKGLINIESNGGTARIEVNVTTSGKLRKGFKPWIIASGIVVIIAIAAIISSAIYQPGTNVISAQDHLVVGEKYIEHKQWDEAIAEFNMAIEMDPKLAVAYINRGDVLSYRGASDRAIADYTMAIVLDPNSDKAYLNRGNIYNDKKDYGKAIDDYTSAITLNPELAEAYNNRGYAYAESSDYDRAIVDYTKAIKLKQNYSEAYYNRGNAYDQKREFDSAIDDYNMAIVLDRDDPEPYISRGYVYFETGKYSEAINDYDAAIELDPHNAEAYSSRGNVYYEKGKFNEAINDCTSAIELDPLNIRAFYTRWHAYQNIGEADKAAADYEKWKEISNRP